MILNYREAIAKNLLKPRLLIRCFGSTLPLKTILFKQANRKIPLSKRILQRGKFSLLKDNCQMGFEN